MGRRDRDSNINIRLDVSIPAGQSASVRRSLRQHVPERLNVLHPTEGGSTFVKQIGSKWYMCAFGTVGDDVTHVFARVYLDGNLSSPLAEPEPGPDTVGTIPDDANRWTVELLPVPGGPGGRSVVFWEYSEDTDLYNAVVRHFTATNPGTYQTYCDYYGVPEQTSLPHKKDWAKMSDRQHFKLAGCTNKGSSNCACLNGDWVLTRDKKCSNPWQWSYMLSQSFADPKKPCYWRLQFNDKDGFWYLDCVGNLNQVAGSWISYRRHESAWNPAGSNSMFLVTNGGFCNVPESVTLVPA